MHARTDGQTDKGDFISPIMVFLGACFHFMFSELEYHTKQNGFVKPFCLYDIQIPRALNNLTSTVPY